MTTSSWVSASKFVSRLADVNLPNVFNPYRDVCAEHDEANAPCTRKKNLTAAIASALDLKVKTIWVARDLGYRGGRRTGLALTDEAHLGEHSRLLGGIELKKSTRSPLIKERTASVVWRMISRIDQPIFMWNVFPLHPHIPEDAMTNRCHTRAERHQTSWALHELLDLLEPERIFTVGGDARKHLSDLKVETVAFRHPSYGGQTQFIAEVERAYGLEDNTERKSGSSDQLALI